MRSTLSLGLVSGLMGHFAKCILLLERRGDHRRTDPPHHFANLLSGALLGIPLVHFMKKTGKDEHISKGASFGMILWALFHSTKSDRSIHHFKIHKYHDNHRSELRSFLSFLLYGVTTACAAKKLGDPGTYPDDEYDFGF